MATINILFLTLYNMTDINKNGIYEDLLRQFIKDGHRVYVVSPAERRFNLETKLSNEEKNFYLLKVKTGNIQKTNVIEKGISTVLLESQFISAIKKYIPDVKFDFVLYSTPPITLAGVIKYVKKRDNAKTYLMLKDIFPQNAVDIGMMSKNGIKGLMYKFFREKEKKLYELSDKIGCMSEANVDFVLRNNPQVPKEIVEVLPNCIEPCDMTASISERTVIREKYGIPQDKIVFVYGGNLGKPQGIPFLIECLKTQKNNDKAFFLIVGNGSEYGKLESFFSSEPSPNMKLMKYLPKEDYDKMVACCDVGLIFLDHRFTIPNFPSRLLGYMQSGLPVLACTDSNTDVGKIAVEGGFGWWCESNDAEKFKSQVQKILSMDLSAYKQKSMEYLCEHYNAEKVYKTRFAPLLDAEQTNNKT